MSQIFPNTLGRNHVRLLNIWAVVARGARRGHFDEPPRNPYDNARAESFFKTLKAEEVHLRRYGNLTEARASIGEFIDEIYDERRLHSALGYRPPSEFEATLEPPSGAARNPRYEFSEA